MNTSPIDGALTMAQAWSLQSQGFFTSRNVVNESQVAVANLAIDRMIGVEPPNVKSHEFQFMHTSSIFMEFMTNQSVVRLCRYLLGDWYRADNFIGLQDGPGLQLDDGLTNITGGPGSEQGAAWFTNGHRPQCGLLNVLIALSDIPPNSGGITIIPGSHNNTSGLNSSRVFEQFTREGRYLSNFTPELYKGDILVIPQATVRGWIKNEKGSQIRYVNYVFCPGYMCSRNPSEIAKYVPLAQNDTAKQILRQPFVHSLDSKQYRSSVI